MANGSFIFPGKGEVMCRVIKGFICRRDGTCREFLDTSLAKHSLDWSRCGNGEDQRAEAGQEKEAR